ncbi:hypothetical protein ILUMI_13940 [Ignelater luminosus]|uniref:Uncharacterized protein n=1 Tax=Ignelater luminosus TaxID=2038154 RepID=A0A8K0GAY2_IGNLU|nr:hypothetical protein ILUMI_13940 [Ignelater luminosus]
MNIFNCTECESFSIKKAWAEEDAGGPEEDITEDDAGNFQQVDATGLEDHQLVKTPNENAYFDAVIVDHVLDKENVHLEIKAHPAVKSTKLNRIHIIANFVIKAPDILKPFLPIRLIL